MHPLQVIRAILSNNTPVKFAKAGFQIFFEHFHFRQRIHFLEHMQMFFLIFRCFPRIADKKTDEWYIEWRLTTSGTENGN